MFDRPGIRVLSGGEEVRRLQKEATDARGPKGEKRPADAIGAATMVARIATGEIEETAPPTIGKDPAAVALGSKGGKARAAGMSAKKRKEIAKQAAKARWQKNPVPAEEE